MAQNITLMGASYSDVPAVQLPKTGGGTALFADPSGVTAVAADVAQGKFFLDALGVLTAGTASGGGGAGLTYESGTYTTDSNVARPTISFAKTRTKPPIFVWMHDVTAASPQTQSQVLFGYIDADQIFGRGWPYGSGSRYGMAIHGYTQNNTSPTVANTIFQYPSSNTGSSSSSYPRYYVTEASFRPYSNSTSRYWRADRTYKWLAVWAPGIT